MDVTVPIPAYHEITDGKAFFPRSPSKGRGGNADVLLEGLVECGKGTEAAVHGDSQDLGVGFGENHLCIEHPHISNMLLDRSTHHLAKERHRMRACQTVGDYAVMAWFEAF